MLDRSKTWICQKGKKGESNCTKIHLLLLATSANCSDYFFLKCFDVCVHSDCEGYTLFKGIILCVDISAQTSQVYSHSLEGLGNYSKNLLEMPCCQQAV